MTSIQINIPNSKTAVLYLLIILSFNSRPLAEACSKLGLDPVVIDFFGDEDIRQYTNESYFYSEEHELKDASHDKFKNWALKTLEKILKEHQEPLGSYKKPFILIGSGFDDDVEFWNECSDMAFLLGNDGNTIEKARNFELIMDICTEKGLKLRFPRTLKFTLRHDINIHNIALEIMRVLNFPLLIKKTRSGGGFGINFIQNEAILKDVLQEFKFTSAIKQSKDITFRAQQYVYGSDCKDISMLANDGEVICVTEQLIGEPRVFPPKKLSYCGNIIPLDTITDAVLLNLKEFAKMIKDEFCIKGLYGVDFVMKGTELYFVEINPRIPGSLEPANIALDENLMALHFNSFPAFDKRVNGITETTPAKYTSIKCILFAKSRFSMPKLKDLKISGKLKDITPPGTILKAGMPVLTYLNKQQAKNAQQIKELACREITKIYEEFRT
ncbi:MAG: ATP-grasp domain-containing protein [Candidatus Hodarchaeota archaeon]